jgi:hypothetical protein
MRHFITIMEAIKDDSLHTTIINAVRAGEHEGFAPYWKLNADPRVLEDESAMFHIAELIAAGFDSGHQPDWSLKTIEPATAPSPDNVPPTGNIFTDHPAMGFKGVSHAMVDEEEITDADIDIDHQMVAADIDAELTPHTVVGVAENDGPGNGWHEVSDEAATRFVVVDAEDAILDYYPDRNTAEAHAHGLNHGKLLDEEIDNGMDDLPNYAVIIQAIHERGEQQQRALAELDARGLWLNDQQKAQAGLI